MATKKTPAKKTPAVVDDLEVTDSRVEGRSVVVALSDGREVTLSTAMSTKRLREFATAYESAEDNPLSVFDALYEFLPPEFAATFDDEDLEVSMAALGVWMNALTARMGKALTGPRG